VFVIQPPGGFSPFGVIPPIFLSGGIMTKEQHLRLLALAENPKFARKLLSAIEASPRLEKALWDICGLAHLTLAFFGE
jgi:hypothetical protein